MNTQAHTEIKSQDTTAHKHTSDAETALGFAVMGCLAAGAVGIVKALEMERASDVLLCLLGAVAAFGFVICLYIRKD